MINWGQKKYGPQAKGIQIGPRKTKSGGMPSVDFSGAGKAIAGGLNAVGRAARGATQARENFNKPKPKAPSRKSTSKMR